MARHQRGVGSDEVYELTFGRASPGPTVRPFDAEDVVFTVELGKMPSVPFAPLWDWLESVEAVDSHTVRFTFSNPRYQQWANFIYFHPMVPEHIWRDFARRTSPRAPTRTRSALGRTAT